MAKRERIAVAKSGGAYFVSDKPDFRFISSGCTVLDCALGGGYVLGRIANIVGDKSTAKTGLCTEAIANFLRKYPNGVAAYRDAEAAFDTAYAEAMGMPISKVDFGDPDKPLTTVEEFARDIDEFIEKRQAQSQPGLYILDSLDALSDEAEMKREIGEASYGANKAKALSEFFRKLTRKIEKSGVALIVVSQVRDNIGAMFGEKHKRSGGKALDFYASQIVWLSHMKTLKKTINKIERPVGIQVRAKVKKNKISMPFRECDFSFMFGYGIDDLEASLTYLEEVGQLKASGADSKTAHLKAIAAMEDDAFHAEIERVGQITRKVWRDVETTFLPTRPKYG